MLSTKEFIEDFLVILKGEDEMKAMSELDNSWGKYGVPDEIYCGSHWKVFFDKKEYLESAIKFLKSNGIPYKRCRVNL